MFINESRARVAERCLRQFYWFHLHNGHGIRTNRTDDKLSWGSLLHAGLAAHYSNQDIPSALQEELNVIFPEWDNLPADTKNEWLDELEWIQKVLGRYKEWARSRDHFKVEGVEQVGVVILGEQCWRCGTPYPLEELPENCCRGCGAQAHSFVFRLDLLVRTPDGIEVIDHKSTSSSVDERYLASWEYSSQLWGYSYGASKQFDLPIKRYGINIIRKVNSAGEEPDLTKQCPECRNGSKKRLACVQCEGTGRVARPLRSADLPFHRETFSFTEAKKAWFVESRTKCATKIVEHQRRLDEGDLSAFPKNPSACYKCPLTDVCYQPNLRDWCEAWLPEEKYLTKGPDYVTLHQMALEEGL